MLEGIHHINFLVADLDATTLTPVPFLAHRLRQRLPPKALIRSLLPA